jgi:hypothetical protein
MPPAEYGVNFIMPLASSSALLPTSTRQMFAATLFGNRGSSVDRAFTHGLEEGGPCHDFFSCSMTIFFLGRWMFL